ncbi:LysR family transcriptional regulator [Mesobaculum littorinae]|uniref:LysR family transcriptional regulator n=1 Tax=Mesobaculum littorinae TaxID=2486419 RepID=A0A438AHC4_9RHOB|nr:LysR family transcriptional regulator [Mesobaculum littorinae]RVV98129.1 LysR family transcriptional regulator [Mesobaculum littorinae]
MKIDVNGLQAFIAIADAGSFNAAAQRLNLSQTALSHRIAKLETELGIALFVRTTRRLALTPEALALLPRARRSITDLEGALGDLKRLGELRRREVTLGCIPSLASSVLAEILHDFRASHPGVRVRVIDTYAWAIAEQVDAGQVEFALLTREGPQARTQYRALYEEDFVAVCRQDHALADTSDTTWADLAQHDLIGNSVVNDALRSTGILAHWTYQAENIATAVGFVKAGLGVSIVPKLEQSQPGYQGLRTIGIKDPRVTRTIGLLTRTDTPPSDAAAALIELIVDRLTALGPAATT